MFKIDYSSLYLVVHVFEVEIGKYRSYLEGKENLFSILNNRIQNSTTWMLLKRCQSYCVT